MVFHDNANLIKMIAKLLFCEFALVNNAYLLVFIILLFKFIENFLIFNNLAVYIFISQNHRKIFGILIFNKSVASFNDVKRMKLAP